MTMRVACTVLFLMGLIGWPIVYVVFLIERIFNWSKR